MYNLSAMLIALAHNNGFIITTSVSFGVLMCYVFRYFMHSYAGQFGWPEPSSLVQTIIYSTLLWSNAFIALQFNFSAFFWTGYASLIIVLTCIDFLYGLLPRYLVLSLAILGGVYQIWELKSDPLSVLLNGAVGYLGMAIFYYAYIWLRKRPGMGYGDVYLTMALSIWCGAVNLPLILFISSATAIFYLLIWRVISNRKISICAFGPFLCLGATYVLIFINQ